MSFVTFVSGRYLRTRQKRAFISLITVLSIAGVSVGVMALIVVIAVMAGFESDLKQRIMGIRPHMVITQKTGDFDNYQRLIRQLTPTKGIETASAFISTQVVLRTDTRVAGAVMKGVQVTADASGISGVDTQLLASPSDTATPQNHKKNRHCPGLSSGKNWQPAWG